MLGLVTVILLLGWAARSQFPASAPGYPALSEARAAEAADEANTARTAPAPTSGPTPASARAGAGASSPPIRTELSRSALMAEERVAVLRAADIICSRSAAKLVANGDLETTSGMHMFKGRERVDDIEIGEDY